MPTPSLAYFVIQMTSKDIKDSEISLDNFNHFLVETCIALPDYCKTLNQDVFKIRWLSQTKTCKYDDTWRLVSHMQICQWLLHVEDIPTWFRIFNSNIAETSYTNAYDNSWISNYNNRSGSLPLVRQQIMPWLYPCGFLFCSTSKYNKKSSNIWGDFFS